MELEVNMLKYVSIWYILCFLSFQTVILLWKKEHTFSLQKEMTKKIDVKFRLKDWFSGSKEDT